MNVYCTLSHPSAVQKLTIRVKGSSPDPYENTFLKDGDSLTAICTCPAGTYGNLCKHRVAIIEGDASAVIAEDGEKVPRVVSWLPGTDVAAALAELRRIEAESGKDKDLVANAKRKLARAMNT